MVLSQGKVNVPYTVADFRGTPEDKNLLMKMGFIVSKPLRILNKSTSILTVATNNKQIRISTSMASKVLVR